MADGDAVDRTDLPPTSRWDDARLVQELKAGNDAALAALIDRYWVPLVQYAGRFLITQDQAEDIVQEAFVRLWSRRSTWRQTRTFRPILYQITRNLALNEKRRRKKFFRWAKGLRGSDRDPYPAPDRLMRQAELKRVVEEAVEALPDRRREIFLLVRTHQMTYREVAQVLGIAPQTVANQMSSALQDLRGSLGPHFESWEPEEIPFPRSGAG